MATEKIAQLKNSQLNFQVSLIALFGIWIISEKKKSLIKNDWSVELEV